MRKIYLMVLELSPDNLGGNVADVNQSSCMGGDVMLSVTRSMTSRARDVITRAASRATSLWHYTDRRRSAENAKFLIF